MTTVGAAVRLRRAKFDPELADDLESAGPVASQVERTRHRSNYSGARIACLVI